MTNVPKPDLEHGAYIVYTDEPGEVLSPGSTGGGGAVYLELEYDADSTPLYIPKFSYNDVKTNIEAGKIVCIRSIYTDAGADIIETHLVDTTTKFSDPVEYVVQADRNRFLADAPDIPMTYDDE